MVAPNRRTQRPTAPTATVAAAATSSSLLSSHYVAVVVKILLILLILFSLPKLVTAESAKQRRKRTELKLRKLRWTCQNERMECARLVPQESLNCVNLCISAACYQQVYGEYPLEDGEVDVKRAMAFEGCVKNELRDLRQQKRPLPRDTQ
jgi:Domain of unknown function (DUF4787)